GEDLARRGHLPVEGRNRAFARWARRFSLPDRTRTRRGLFGRTPELSVRMIPVRMVRIDDDP
ncbi:MAG TPA: hypothetical protein VML50_10125, partial [Anaeromyxobacter sp.]|nr:hypothetical protein [Anaeromyxobacter sp.]